MPESYVVIGGEGFLGNALVKAIRAKYPEAAVASFDVVERHSPRGWTFAPIDLTDLESLTSALQRAGATVVFHTASPAATTSTKELCTKVNVDGTRTVVQACQAAKVPELVYTSSAGVVYDMSNLINIDERLPYPEKFVDHYNLTKVRENLPCTSFRVPYEDAGGRRTDSH
jgi:sterol-4alpha-carboxylate 3-dehydrogenase (decarboxylating)